MTTETEVVVIELQSQETSELQEHRESLEIPEFSETSETPKRKCPGHEGYKCGVSLEGFHFNRLRCDKCAKARKRETSNAWYAKKVEEKRKADVRICLGYKVHKCEVSLKGTHPHTRRCRPCYKKNKSQMTMDWQRRRKAVKESNA